MAGYLREKMLEAGGIEGKELATRAKIGQSTISRTLNAQRDVTAVELAAICRVLELDPTTVLTEVASRMSPVATRSPGRSGTAPRRAATGHTMSA